MVIYKNEFTGTVRMYNGQDNKYGHYWNKETRIWEENGQPFKLTSALPFYHKLDKEEMKEYE